MKPLSESLEELAARVKRSRTRRPPRSRRIEPSSSSAATRSTKRSTDLGEFDSAVREAAHDGRTWWNETKASMKRPLDELRARVDKRQSEHELHRAVRAADAAEEDAAAAIEVAAYFLNVAEYAVIDATLARMAADDLAEAAPTRLGSDVMMRPFVGSWKRLAVHGVAAVLFGMATLVWPSITLWALVLLWGAFVFVDGVTALSAAIADRLLAHRGWVAFRGVTGIAAGVVTFLWPSITALALLVVIAAWALLIGGSRIAFAISTRKQVPRSLVRRPRRCPAGAAGRAPRGQPRCRRHRHHVGDRLARLPVRHRRAVRSPSGVRHETQELTTHTGVNASQPSTRSADMTTATAAHAHPAAGTTPAAVGERRCRVMLRGATHERPSNVLPTPEYSTSSYGSRLRKRRRRSPRPAPLAARSTPPSTWSPSRSPTPSRITSVGPRLRPRHRP